MTLGELKNNIMLFLYRSYKNNKLSPISFIAICRFGKIAYDSERQMEDAFLSLNKLGYIDVYSFAGKGMVRAITPLGIEYVRENLLTEEEKRVDAFRDITMSFQNGATPYDGNQKLKLKKKEESGDREETIPTKIIYDTIENYKETLDQGVPPCFGINTLADCYIKQMDQIAIKADDKFRMLGIFGPWGRGKTYFFNRIKEKLQKRKLPYKWYSLCKEDDENNILYKIVDFNAWKYQDTPAIWAYLYENLYNSLSWCEKIRYNIKYLVELYFKNILFYIFIFIVFWIIFYLGKRLASDPIPNKIDIFKLPFFISLFLLSIADAYIKNPLSVSQSIKKYIQRKSYNGILGIQNDLEVDIEKLLKYMVSKPNKNQILLYVDDIDRCSTDKMLHIINSLRIILENKEIQKRLIVICSVDAEKLKQGYCLSKNVERDDERFLKEAREHLDKLFIFGIGLSSIDYFQQLEYLEHLTDLGKSNNEKIENTAPFSTSRPEGSFAATSTSNEIPKFDDNYIYEIMKDFLFKHQNIEFTPRKIRIMYYRLLFANNIIASGKARITNDVAIKILEKSVNYKESVGINNAMSDVIHCVVPY